MAKTAKKAAKKTTKKNVDGNKSIKLKKSDQVIQLMLKKNGATIHDFVKVGFNQPAMAAVKAAKRRNLKVKIIPRDGSELTRYQASK